MYLVVLCTTERKRDSLGGTERPITSVRRCTRGRVEHKCLVIHKFKTESILGLQPIPGDPKDNGVAAMLDDRTFCFVIQHGRHAIVFLDLQGFVANQEF